MKKPRLIILAFFLCAALFAPLRAESAVVERFVAVVNEEVIFLSELEELGKRYFEEVEKNAPPGEAEPRLREARKEVLAQLIDNKLLSQEIKKRKVEVSEKDVDAAVDDLLRQNRISLDDLKMALAKEGLTLTAYRERLRDGIGKMRLISREIKSKIVLKEEDLRKAYRDRIQEFMIPLEVKVQQIFLSAPRAGSSARTAAAEKEALEILERTKTGADFSELAKNHSQSPEGKDGGVLGFFKTNELMPELEEAAFSLEPGAIGPLVRSPEGFHILKVLERKGGEPKTFAEVQGRIREEMMQAESEKRFREWLRDLKEKAYIEIKL